MRWAEIKVDCQSVAEEPVVAALSKVVQFTSVFDGGKVIKAWVPVDDRVEGILEQVCEGLDSIDCASLGISPPQLTISYTEDHDWNMSWREFFRPFEIAGRIRIRPPWDRPLPESDKIDIVIDPGMAFGTGQHPTTEMMLTEMVKTPMAGQRVVDVGSGSAILSIVAVKLGAKDVVAVEVDPVAEENARKNIRANGAVRHVHYVVRDGVGPDMGKFDLALMNIVADVILKLAPQVYDILRPGGVVIASGIIERRLKEVKAALRKMGFTVTHERKSGEWRLVTCEKPRLEGRMA